MTSPAVILPKATAKPAPPVAEIPPMALDEAYKALRVTAGASWAEVEQARFKIVQRAHPDTVAELSAAKRIAAQTEAKRANAAKTRASCGSAARGDLCGGYRVTDIPTATQTGLSLPPGALVAAHHAKAARAPGRVARII